MLPTKEIYTLKACTHTPTFGGSALELAPSRPILTPSHLWVCRCRPTLHNHRLTESPEGNRPAGTFLYVALVGMGFLGCISLGMW